MNQSFCRRAAALCVMAGPLLLGACATNDSVQHAQSTADAASAKADQANMTAQQALQAAQAANQAAQAASAKADKAQADIATTNQRVDEMFQHSLRK